jgi:hypothetical protein
MSAPTYCFDTPGREAITSRPAPDARARATGYVPGSLLVKSTTPYITEESR